MKRRTFIQKTATVGAFAVYPHISLPSILKNERMGFSQATYAVRWRHSEQSKTYPPFLNALDLLDHTAEVGAGGIQVGVGHWDKQFARKVRRKSESLDLYFEGQISLPKSESDTSRFESEILAGKEAGAKVFRTACLSGRRYANFDSMEAFQAFKKQSLQSLEWAEAIVRKHAVKLAVENHKDWRAEELVEIIKRFDSAWLGVTLDTGNNVAFMEDPMEVIETLAPYAFTTHIKDMAYCEYSDGILLSEVPLGEGIVDLEMAIALIKKHNPEITFNLEMITRDPLEVPCLTENYWATFDHGSSGYELARTLRNVKQHSFHLPTVSEKDMEGTLAFEEENNLKSLKYSADKLGLV